MAEDFIGRGISFPLRVDDSGRIATSTGADSIEEGMRMIISTAPGERAMRPDFGCPIWDQLFESMDPTSLGRIELAVRESLVRWEPRVEIEAVRATVGDRADGLVDIHVSYRIRDRNDVRNLVYPFYVIPQE